MKDYAKIPFDQFDDVEFNNIESYIEDKLKVGQIIIQILVDEDNQQIAELISYANDKECKSYYRNITDSDEQLRTCVITETLEPYYAFKDKKYYSGESFKDDDVTMHYEFYISIEKGDIANFGGCLEIDFVTEWMEEQGYYSK